jgi:Sulfotransferase family
VFICDSRRLLFVHIQKTGGTSVTRLLLDAIPDGRVQGGPQQHVTLPRVLKREPELAGYWTFGFVRNPWARMVSWWSRINDNQAQAAAGGSGAAAWLEKTTFRRAVAAMPDFDTFIAKAPEEWEVFRRPQVRWLTSPTRRADFVGRTETLTADIRAVFARFDLPLPDELPRSNPSNHDDYHDYYTDATRARVGEIFAQDIATFGYEF